MKTEDITWALQMVPNSTSKTQLCIVDFWRDIYLSDRGTLDGTGGYTGLADAALLTPD